MDSSSDMNERPIAVAARNPAKNPFTTNPIEEDEQAQGGFPFIMRENFEQVEFVLEHEETAIIALAGEHGSGKSSLMHHLLYVGATKCDYVPAMVTASLFHHFEKQYEAGIECLRGLLQRLRNRLNVPNDSGLGTRFSTAISHPAGTSTPAGPGDSRTFCWSADVKELLDQAATKRGCLLAIDDLDSRYLTPDDRAEVLQKLLAVRQFFADARLRIILVGDKNLPAELRQVETNFYPVELTPWTPKLTATYVRRQELRDHRLLVSDEQIETLWEASDGAARTLAYLCHTMFEEGTKTTPARFKLTKEIIKRVSKLVGQQAEIQALSDENIQLSELRRLRHVVPFPRWTAEEMARYQSYQEYGEHLTNGGSGEIEAHRWFTERLTSINGAILAYRMSPDGQRGVFPQQHAEAEPPRALTTGLQRVYLRLHASDMRIAWPNLISDLHGQTTTYEAWVEHELKNLIVAKLHNTGFQPWARLNAVYINPGIELRSRIADWQYELEQRVFDPHPNDRQIRLFEDVSAQDTSASHYVYRQDTTEGQLFRDLAEQQGPTNAMVLGVQCHVEQSPRSIVLLFGRANDARVGKDFRQEVEQALHPYEQILGFAVLEVVMCPVRLPAVDALIRRDDGRPAPRKELVLACFYALISLGRRDLDCGRAVEAREWFTKALQIPDTGDSARAIALEHLVYTTLALAQGSSNAQDREALWADARSSIKSAIDLLQERETTTGTSAYDNLLLSHAMMWHDLAYIAALQRNMTDAQRNCGYALSEPSTERIISTIGFTRLLSVEGLSEQCQSYFDNEFSRWMVLAASIHCILAAVLSPQPGHGMSAADFELERAERIHPGHYMVLRARGRYLLRKGEFQAALQRFEAANAAYEQLMREHVGDLPGGAGAQVTNVIQREIEFTRESLRRQSNHGSSQA